jgi:hypothetical protein
MFVRKARPTEFENTLEQLMVIMGKRRKKDFEGLLLSVIFLSFLCLGLEGRAWAQDTPTDTLSTPFIKGRWLSGLNGSFSSNTLKLASEEELFTTNSYGLEIFTGVFFQDRWFAGFNVLAARSSGAGVVERESESLLIGPSVAYYFLKEPYGSLYMRVLPGYFRFREKGSASSEAGITTQLAEGPGFATRLRLGYSYVISRRIVLDVGVGTTLAWLDVEYTSDSAPGSRNESVFSNSTFFSFGFNVLLDEFFF